jgi:hypothetical protein
MCKPWYPEHLFTTIESAPWCTGRELGAGRSPVWNAKAATLAKTTDFPRRKYLCGLSALCVCDKACREAVISLPSVV